MKLWLTPSEIADLRLPGLPTSKRNVNALAEREGWAEQSRFARPRAGRGGGMEYRIDLLPLEARMAYAARFTGGIADEATVVVAELPDAPGDLPPPATAARDARIHIVGAARAFRRNSDIGQTAAAAVFVDLYNARRLDMPAWVVGAVPRLSARSLHRWLAAYREGEVDRLAVDRGRARRGKGVLETAEAGALKAAALGLIAHQPHLSADHVRTILLDRFGETVRVGDKAVPMPSIRDFQRRLAGWKSEHATELLAITNPDKFLSTKRVSGSYAAQVTRLDELWQIDASPADVLCVDGRWSIYVCVDVYSRRIIGYVSRTPRAEAVGLLLRKAIGTWGVPERIKTDNGSDFKARIIRRFLAAMQIEVETSHAYSPWEKGVVERAIGTVQRDFMPLLPGFIGHDVTDRKAIEGRRRFAERLGLPDERAFCVEMTGEELSTLLDRHLADRYAHRPHGALGKRSPFQIAAGWRGAIRRVEDPAALAILLAPVAGNDGRRVVGKFGIRIEGSHYLASSLVVGETVFVRMDPADMGRAWVFDEDGETYRCEAICPELAGVDRAAAVAAARAEQKRLIDERTAPIKAEAKKIKPRDMVEAVARQAAKTAGKLVELPKPTTTHATPALDGAKRALRNPRAAAPQPLRPETAALLDRIEQEVAGAPVGPRSAGVTPLRTHETKQQRFRRFLQIEAAMAAGDEIPTEDAIWFGRYSATPECAAMRGMYADFGDAALS